MSVHTWTVWALTIALSVCTIAAVGLALGAALGEEPCDHTLRPEVHDGTGRPFAACRCGERFQR